MGHEDARSLASPAHRSSLGRGDHSWNATKCHRLLRPLQARLSILRKLHGAEYPGLASDTEGPAAEGLPTRPQQRGRPRKRPASENEPPIKRIRYTYSQKRAFKTTTTSSSAIAAGIRSTCAATRPPASGSYRTLVQKPSLPGEINLPTPLLRRFKDVGPLSVAPRSDNSPPVPASCERRASGILGGKESKAFSCFQDLLALRKSTAPSVFRHYSAIYSALDALLRSTSMTIAPSNSKSLLSMCLRKLPDYVAGRQLWEESLARRRGTIHSSDVSFQIYSDLEHLGPTGMAWKPLREAVRAHGVTILGDAISEGLFSPSFVAILSRLCLSHECKEEACLFLESLADRLYPEPRSPASCLKESKEMEPLSTMVDTALAAGAAGFLMSALDRLFSTGNLPSKWLSTPAFNFVWVEAAKGLATEKYFAASDFISNSLCLLSTGIGVRPATKKLDEHRSFARALTETFASLAGAITAMAMAYQEGHAKQHQDQYQRRLVHILQRSLAMLIWSGNKKQAPGVAALALCSHLSVQGLEASLVPPAGSQDHEAYRTIVNIICSTARCCARGSEGPPSAHLSSLCDRLSVAHSWGVPLARLRADASFILAQQTNDLRDLAFAEALSPQFRDAPSATNELGGAMFSGYRWEEGISEWILASPETKCGPEKVTRVASTAEEGLRRDARQSHRNMRASAVLRDRPGSGARSSRGRIDNTGDTISLPGGTWRDEQRRLVAARETAVDKENWGWNTSKPKGSQVKSLRRKTSDSRQGRLTLTSLVGSDDELGY